MAGEVLPACRAERWSIWVAGGGEDRGDENDCSAGAAGAAGFGGGVGGGCNQSGGAAEIGPASGAEMAAGFQPGGEACVAGDDHWDVPGFAKFGGLRGEGGAVGRAIMAEDDAGTEIRQKADAGERV